MEGSLCSPRNNFYYEQVGPYKIEKHCYEANPCRHYVLNVENGFYSLMTGKEIFIILKKYNLKLPHFNYLNGRIYDFCCLTLYKSF